MPNQPQFRYDVYISYNEADAEWVFEWLLPRLKDAGLSVAIDAESFQPGAPVLEESERVIGESRYILAVLTPAYVAEGWDNFETLLVQNEDPGARFRRLIPILLEECEPPARIKLLHWVEMTDPLRREEQLQRVIDSVQGKDTLPELHPERIPDARQRWWELRWLAVVGAISALTLLLLLFLVWILRPDPPPTTMPEGTFNIAVVPFDAIDVNGAPTQNSDSQTRAVSVVNYLRSQEESLTAALGQQPTIWGPDEGIPAILVANMEEEANRLNADVLIYGTLREGARQQWQLEPHFYLTEETARKASATASELQGPFALGRPIVYTAGTFVGVGDVNVVLSARLEALIHLLRGLVYLFAQDARGYDLAERAFLDATATDWGQSEDEGQEILYHFLGNAYLQQLYYAETEEAPLDERQQILESALTAFTQAHRLNSDYLRAINGLGGTYFQLARLPIFRVDACAWDWDLLTEAQRHFERVLAADELGQAEAGDAGFNAHFFLGRIHFTLTFCQRADSMATARDFYQTVRRRYEADPREERRRAMVLTYRELAHTYFYDPANPALRGDDPQLAEIVDLYEKSLDLALEIDTEQSLSMAQDSMIFLLNALCRADQLQQLKTRWETFPIEDPLVRARILTLAELPEECQNVISTP
jgi:hypothetical protein